MALAPTAAAAAAASRLAPCRAAQQRWITCAARTGRRGGASLLFSAASYCGQQCSREGWRRPLEGGPPAADGSPTAVPPIVALGKFDAMHRGHQALGMAAAELGGTPWMVSFSGIAEVLGWASRLPLVAPSDRGRVLRTWTDACQGRTPRECCIPFAEVRTMSPEAFVALLAEELAVAGVVVGANYRFGYKAAGTAELLQQLGPQHGLKVRVLGLVGGEEHGERVVSSSHVRDALGRGDLAEVERSLGRPYRLVASLGGAAAAAGISGKEPAAAAAAAAVVQDGTAAASGSGSEALWLPAAALENQPPGAGEYEVRVSLLGSGPECSELMAPWQARLLVSQDGLRLEPAGSREGWPTSHPASLLALDFC